MRRVEQAVRDADDEALGTDATPRPRPGRRAWSTSSSPRSRALRADLAKAEASGNDAKVADAQASSRPASSGWRRRAAGLEEFSG